jgi:hypothetical protein
MPTRFQTPAQYPRTTRPDWELLENDHDYFVQVLGQLFQAQGYAVAGIRNWPSQLDNQPREAMFFLERQGQMSIGLGLRWLLMVTSDVIGGFTRALGGPQESRAVIVTTSLFTEAAVQSASRLSIELYDRDRLWQVITKVWP